MNAGPLVIVGDVLLDREVIGTVDRLCPEAPVPVLAQQSTVDRPGGAGLAATLAASSGGPGRSSSSARSARTAPVTCYTRCSPGPECGWWRCPSTG
jgi:hypothetical protein